MTFHILQTPTLEYRYNSAETDHSEGDEIPKFLTNYVKQDDESNEKETEKLLVWMQQLTQEEEEITASPDVSKIFSQSSSILMSQEEEEVIMLSQEEKEQEEEEKEFFHLDKMEEDDEDPDEIMNAIMESQAIFESHENQILDTLEEEDSIVVPSSSLTDSLVSNGGEEEKEVEEENKSTKSRRKLFQSGNQGIEEEILRLKAKSLPGHLSNKILSRLDGLKDFSADISSHEGEESVLVEEENVVEEKALVEEIENQSVSMNDFQQDDFSSQSESVFAEPASQTEPVFAEPAPVLTTTNTSGWWTPTQLPPPPVQFYDEDDDENSDTSQEDPIKSSKFNKPPLIRLSGPLKIMSIEILCSTRPNRLPDPKHDRVCCVSYIIYQESTKMFRAGAITISSDNNNTSSEMKPFTEWRNQTTSFEEMSLPKSPSRLNLTYVVFEALTHH